MPTLTLYEMVNDEKLQKVVMCNNIPFESTDDFEWFEQFKKILKIYSQTPTEAGKGKKVIYVQTNEYGRFSAKSGLGLQLFQRDVRKYISGEYTDDWDIENCHPNILEQLFMKHDITCDKFLYNYNRNRKQTIKKFGLKDKLSFIKVINNENEPSNPVMKENWMKRNELIKKLLKEPCNKNLLARIKKKKSSNIFGSFMAYYLQNIENNILQVMYQFCMKNNITVQSLMFDGFTTTKGQVQNKQEFIKQLENEIQKKTGYTMKITNKSTETDWEPSISDLDTTPEEELSTEYIDELDTEYLNELFAKCWTKEGFCNQTFKETVVPYLNNFLCRFQRPLCYGWREQTNLDFTMIKMRPDVVKKDIFKRWLEFNNKLNYLGMVFIVDEADRRLKQNYYNTYQRPPMKSFEGNITDICPLFFDYLFRVLSSSNEKVYNYLIHYIAKMVQKGSTHQCIVLRGNMGAGKSSFPDCLKIIISERYFVPVNSIDTITSQFNAMFENAILTSIEEIVTNAGEYHAVQNKLKSLITEKRIAIQKKGIDTYITETNNNYILITNGQNPVKITKDNRRNLVLDVSDVELGNANYFFNMKKQLIENIEQVRHYFNTFEFYDNLNSIRPVTDAERELLSLNKDGAESYIDDVMELKGDKSDESRLFNNVYECYKRHCQNEGKKSYNKAWFSAFLKKNGFTIDIFGTGNNRKHFIQGNTPTREVNIYGDTIHSYSFEHVKPFVRHLPTNFTQSSCSSDSEDPPSDLEN